MPSRLDGINHSYSCQGFLPLLACDCVRMQVPSVDFHFINIVKFLAADVTFFSGAPAVKIVG